MKRRHKTQVVSCDGSVDGKEFIVVSDHKAFKSYNVLFTNMCRLGTGYSNVQLLPSLTGMNTYLPSMARKNKSRLRKASTSMWED